MSKTIFVPMWGELTMITLLEILETLLEYSKNDPVPEITREKNKLAIFLIGGPGSGKSTFYKNFILSRNSDIKYINSDDISTLYTKDEKEYYSKTKSITYGFTKNFMNTNNSFVLDCTGKNMADVSTVIHYAATKKYKIIFIHMLASLNKSIEGNMSRNRNVPEDILKDAYAVTQKLIIFYEQFNPDKYYLVVNLWDKYVFYLKEKFGKITKIKSVVN